MGWAFVGAPTVSPRKVWPSFLRRPGQDPVIVCIAPARGGVVVVRVETLNANPHGWRIG